MRPELSCGQQGLLTPCMLFWISDLGGNPFFADPFTLGITILWRYARPTILRNGGELQDDGGRGIFDNRAYSAG